MKCSALEAVMHPTGGHFQKEMRSQTSMKFHIIININQCGTDFNLNARSFFCFGFRVFNQLGKKVGQRSSTRSQYKEFSAGRNKGTGGRQHHILIETKELEEIITEAKELEEDNIISWPNWHKIGISLLTYISCRRCFI